MHVERTTLLGLSAAIDANHNSVPSLVQIEVHHTRLCESRPQSVAPLKELGNWIRGVFDSHVQSKPAARDRLASAPDEQDCGLLIAVVKPSESGYDLSERRQLRVGAPLVALRLPRERRLR
jgi:hypothetical protein